MALLEDRHLKRTLSQCHLRCCTNARVLAKMHSEMHTEVQTVTKRGGVF